MRNVLLIFSFGILWLVSGCSRPQYAHFRPAVAPPVAVRASEVAMADVTAPSDMAVPPTASASAEPLLLPPAGLALAAAAPAPILAESAPALSRKELRKHVRTQYKKLKATGAWLLQPEAATQTRTDGLAIASLICGIVGLFFLGILLGPLAIIFGAISLNKMAKNPGMYSGKGMAIAGLVIGVVATLLSIILIALIASSI